MLFVIPVILKQHKAGEFALGLLAATSAGAIGGFGYTLLGAPSRRIPIIGPYVAGVISVGAYMLALLVAAPSPVSLSWRTSLMRSSSRL